MNTFGSITGLSDKNIYLVYYTILASAFIFMLVRRGPKMSQVLKHSAAWLGIFFIISIGYVYQNILRDVLSTLKSHLMPYSANENKDGSVSFIADQNSHFQIEALVEGKPIRFMVDTGATRTTLTVEDAQSLGINTNHLSYDQLTDTANGSVYVAKIRLSEIKIGDIIVNDVRASVSKTMDGYSLLGMSFLEKLKGYKVEGNRLTLLN
ncbi:MAG: TIGR02281 family clan AA aspartic protease [Alphaproteobacteria bacterium]